MMDGPAPLPGDALPGAGPGKALAGGPGADGGSDRVPGGLLGRMSAAFENIEHAILIVLGLVLSVAALIALGSSVLSVWHTVLAWGDAKELLHVIDLLLFVLMIAEILHTVRVSIRSGTLTCEPFLIVGLIASIRRVLVITLESSQYTPGKPSSPGGSGGGNSEVFQSSMIELGVLSVLIMVMVISIYLLRQRRPGTDHAG